MKKFLFLSLLSCSTLLAETRSDGLPDSGIYIGMAAEGVRNENDWQLNAFSLGAMKYQDVNYSKNSWSFSPQFFLGYKKDIDSFFCAAEIAWSPNKNKVSEEFPLAAGTHPLAFPAALKVQNGNDLSFSLKVGKSFLCYQAYFVAGVCSRNLKFNFNYLPTGMDDDIDAALRNSCSEKNKTVYRPQFGCGIAYSLKNDVEIGLEYLLKMRGKVNLTTTVNTTDIDSPGHPRNFRLKNTQHCVSLRIVKNMGRFL